MVWAPIPLGSNRPWAIGLLAMMVGLLFFVTWSSSVMLGRSFSVITKSFIALGFLLAFAGLLTAQYLNGYQELGILQSFDPYATKIQLILTITCIGLFASILLLCQSTFRLKGLLLTIVLSGALQAVFSIYMLSIQSHYEILFFEVDHSKFAKGTFSYHNSFAGYMEICISAGLGLLLSSFSDETQKMRSLKVKISTILGFILSKKMQLRLLLIIMVVALVLTKSRMGNAGFMIALLLVLILALITMKDLRKTLSWLVASVVLIDALVLGQWVGIDKVVERLESTSLTIAGQGRSESVEQRVEPAFGAILMLKDRPWTGFGAGTFYTAFVPYKPQNLTGYYDHAHNDFIEILVETGVVGFLLLMSFAAISFYYALKLMQSNKNFHRGVGFGVSLALVSIGIHGTVDFNLHIPANILTLVTLCAIASVVKFKIEHRQNIASQHT